MQTKRKEYEAVCDVFQMNAMEAAEMARPDHDRCKDALSRS